VEFLGSGRPQPNDAYEVCIYIDAKKRAHAGKLYNTICTGRSWGLVYDVTFNIGYEPIDNSHQEVQEYIRFAEILSHKGLAFLDEKQIPLNRLLENRLALQSGQQTPEARRWGQACGSGDECERDDW